MRRSKLLFRPPSYTLNKDKRTNLKSGNYVLHFGLGGKTYSFSTFTSDYNKADVKAEEIVHSIWNEWRQKKVSGFLLPSPTPGVPPFSTSVSNKGFLIPVQTEHSQNLPPPLLESGVSGSVGNRVGQPALFHSGTNNGTNGAKVNGALLPTVNTRDKGVKNPQLQRGFSGRIGKWSDLSTKLPSTPQSVEDRKNTEYFAETQEAALVGLSGRQEMKELYGRFFSEVFLNSTKKIYAPGTLEQYQSRGKIFMGLLDIGPRGILGIDQQVVEKLYREMTQLDIVENVYVQAKSHFVRFMKWCFKKKLIPGNPCDGAEFDITHVIWKGKKLNRDLWDYDELMGLLKAYPVIEGKGILFSMLVGMDLCDVSRIEEKYLEGSGSKRVLDMNRKKTMGHVRIHLVPGSEVYETFMYCLGEARKKGYKYIFNPRGLGHREYSRVLNTIRRREFRKMGVPLKEQKLFKTLRHTAITRAKENGLSTHTLNQVVGLSPSSKMADEVYNRYRVMDKDMAAMEIRRVRHVE